MLEEFVSGYHYDGVLEKYLPTGKIIYHNQNKKTGNIFTHSGIIVIGYKEYIVIYIYKFGSHSFCPMRCNFRYIFENSLICTYENIKNYRFVSYIEHKGGKDTVRALRYTLFGSDTVPSNSDDILKRFIEDFNLKLEEYQKKLR
jgi:hypothetical protein